jgi:RNA polymerase sigma-70 factor (ECF subfamily)
VDERTFTSLYETVGKPLRAYVLRVCGKPDIADDIVQDAFFRYILSRRNDLPLAAARPYLFRIATNLLHDRGRHPDALPLSTLEESSGESSAEDTLDAVRLLRMMKPRERQLLWLAYVECMNHREIANVTGLNALSVRVLLLRARRRATHLLSLSSDDNAH